MFFRHAIWVNQHFVTAALGPLPIAGDRLQNISATTEIWAKPVPVPPGHTGKTAVAGVLFNRGQQPARITFDFGLLGGSFGGSEATIFDVIAGKGQTPGTGRVFWADLKGFRLASLERTAEAKALGGVTKALEESPRSKEKWKVKVDESCYLEGRLSLRCIALCERAKQTSGMLADDSGKKTVPFLRRVSRSPHLGRLCYR